MKLTEKQREWLEFLAANGPSRRPPSNTGYACMHRGLTRWVLRLKDGRLMDIDTARDALGPEYFDRIEVWLDAITDAGRLALQHSEDR